MVRLALICTLLLGWTLSGFACGPAGPKAPQPELLVFAAASLSDVLGEVGNVYQNQVEVDLLFNFNGSNVLAQQILVSPKADVFVSANEEWMNVVEQAGRIEAGTRRRLLSNALVIVAPSGSSREMKVATDLCRLDFRLLALGHPEAVPAGRYAKQWLESLSCQDRSLWETVAERISPAPDVRAVLGQVEAVEGVLGIVYQTDYEVARDRVKLLYRVSPDEGPSIRYAVARLQGTPHPQMAESFLDFLYSDAARTIFKNHGFLPLRGEP
jgi:molybdate transport system substrate-binding protein